MWLISLSWAGGACPLAPTWGHVNTEDGGAQVVVWDGTRTCWWTVDDRDEQRLSGRWEGRRPAALAPWGEAGVLIVLSDPEGWRIYAATDPWSAERIGVPLPSPPDQLRVLPGRLVELTWRGPPREGQPTEDTVWLIDVPRERRVDPAG